MTFDGRQPLNNISQNSHDNKSDPRSQNELKLDDHVLHLHDGQDGGGAGHRHGTQGVINITPYLEVIYSAHI